MISSQTANLSQWLQREMCIRSLIALSDAKRIRKARLGEKARVRSPVGMIQLKFLQSAEQWKLKGNTINDEND